jgi:curli production assembly/transport component CsgG
MRRYFRNVVLAAAGMTALTACAGTPGSDKPELALSEVPEHEYRTPSLDELRSLPAPARKVAVAVYRFEDLTGQNKPNDNFSEYSRAVTQGGTSILINALERAGSRSWFTTVERASLQALLQERQIIRVTREEYGGGNLPPLPPLTYAGLMLDGGIIGYDSNTLTGGFGARFLGIGGSTEYRRDTVTVYLRAVSVSTGEVLKSVNVSKTIYSVGLSGGAFRFIDFKKLLELETGVTTNEPVTLAVKSAVEKAVYSLIMEGLIDGYWQLRDMGLAQPLIDRYWQERDGVYDVKSVETTLQDYRDSLRIEPPSGREPVPGANGEEMLVPKIEPGVPAPRPGPTYVLPDGRPVNPDRPPEVPPSALPIRPMSLPTPPDAQPESPAQTASPA